jgi:hypothetical protein
MGPMCCAAEMPGDCGPRDAHLASPASAQEDAIAEPTYEPTQLESHRVRGRIGLWALVSALSGIAL